MNTQFRLSFFSRLSLAAFAAALLSVPIASQAQYADTATGDGALYLNTTGNYDTATGADALYFNTTGSANTATGTSALENNSTGNQNTANGFYALFSNQAGNNNTATGVSALQSNTTGWYNTANGVYALVFNNNGNYNTANGYMALYLNTSGSQNAANGVNALYSNTTGVNNTATGLDALYSNTTGGWNTANGLSALYHNTTGNGNTADGDYALLNATGSFNTGLGYQAGQHITSGSNNIAIGNPGASADSGVIRIGTKGTHTATFIAGINGVTVTGGTAVYILPNGQLGTLTSSRRFKSDIHDMRNVSERLMQLRPVTFRYNDRAEKGPHALQYGLIAEEVAKVYPDLVQYDKAGKPFTVYYHLLTPMLLNELQKEHRQNEAQQQEIVAQRQAIAGMKSEFAVLKERQEHQQSPGAYAVFAGLGLTGAALLRRRRAR